MTLDWIAFTPWPALGGGLLIGGAASLLILYNGRIAGISGILGNLLQARSADRPGSVAFLLGLVTAPLLAGLTGHAPTVDISAGPGALALSGLLVGLGTRFGNGCTSGHGVCGLSRRSARSAVAVCCFMGSGFATVFTMRHLLMH